MLFGQWFVFNHTKIKVSQWKSKSGEEVTKPIANLLILLSFIPWNDIKDHGEHHNENKKEYQEHFKIDDNVCDHCNDVAVRLENLHEEESFQEASEDDNDHDNLGPDIPGSVFHSLHVDVQEAKEDMANVNVVGGIHEIRHSLLEELSTVIDCWVEHAYENSNHVSSVTWWKDSRIILIENVNLSIVNFAHFSLPLHINFILDDDMRRYNFFSNDWCKY